MVLALVAVAEQPLPAAGLVRGADGVAPGAAVAAGAAAADAERDGVALGAVVAAGAGCGGVLGDGTTDDTQLVQDCISSRSVCELAPGACYRISRALLVEGGSDRELRGVGTRLRCVKPVGGLRVSKGASLTLKGVVVDFCGKVSLPKSPEPAVWVAGSLTLDAQSSINNSRYTGVLAWLLEKSAITLRHGSSITYSGRTGIELTTAAESAVVLESGSFIDSSLGGHCIEVLTSRDVAVRLTGKSSLRRCMSNGVYVVGGTDTLVSVESESSIRDCGRRGVHIAGGSNVSVVLSGGALVSDSAESGLELWHGRGLSALVRGATIQRSGHDGILMSSGVGNVLEFINGTIRGASHGIEVLNAESVRMDGANLKEIDGSAIRVEGAYFYARDLYARQDVLVKTERFEGQRISIRKASKALSLAGNMTVNLTDVYLTSNLRGVVCKSDPPESELGLWPTGVVHGVIFYNTRQAVSKECFGRLEWRGPLSRSPPFRSLLTGITIIEPLLIVAMATLPWLFRMLARLWRSNMRPVIWPVCFVLTGVLLVWLYLLMELSEALKHLKFNEYREVKSLWNHCVAGLCLGLLGSSIAPACWRIRRKEKERNAAQDGLLWRLEEALWDGSPEAEKSARRALRKEGWEERKLRHKVQELKRLHSLHAGVSVAYLLSEEFLALARERTGERNPTFLAMKDPFWMREDAIGKDSVCPRDGRRGCALVDTLRPQHRRASTHFLSWVWSYELLHVREALKMWTEEEGLDPRETFLYMCFFVNNQFRILVEGSQSGSDDLGAVFEENLRRIGKVVALLDHWKTPRYLTRIWTIFEQYTAEKLGIPVTMILAKEAAEELIAEIDMGKAGIERIKDSLCNVKAEEAEASVKADEEKVKAMIRSTIGFDRVNRRVQRSMVTWVAAMLRRHIDQLMHNDACGGDWVMPPVRRVTCAQLPRHWAGMQPMELDQS